MGDAIREQASAASALPADMAAGLGGYHWARDMVGESGSAVYRLWSDGGQPDLYLKHGRGRVAEDSTDELVRLRWLGQHLPVSQVRRFHWSEDEAGRPVAGLLMAAVPGRTAYQLLDDDPDVGPAVVDALASFLRRLHAIPIDDCPFRADHALRLRLAEQRMTAGLVETDDFDAARAGWSAEAVWAAMTGLLPMTPDPVVTHGDFSLDNLLLVDGVVTGCIDVGRLGVADRYQDLAILWNCLGEFAPGLQDRLFHSYGIAQPDERKLRFHLMLDEFF